MSPHFRETFDAVAAWPCYRVIAALELAEEIDRAHAQAEREAEIEARRKARAR